MKIHFAFLTNVFCYKKKIILMKIEISRLFDAGGPLLKIGETYRVSGFFTFS